MPENSVVRWAREIQAISQTGLAYSKDPYDVERFERLRALAAEMAASASGTPIERVRALFEGETGYPTPKLDTRAAVVQNGRILLVRENSGKWSLPGGWVDADQSIGSNAEKEVLEEAGVCARATRLIAVVNANRRNGLPGWFSVCKAFVLCEPLGGSFQPNIETTGSGYFAPDALPALSMSRNTPEQIAMCFQAHADENWRALFD